MVTVQSGFAGTFDSPIKILCRYNLVNITINIELIIENREIMNSLHLFRFECSVNNVFSTKTLYELYEFYSILNKNNKQGIVSKRYFEKITREIINDHIDIDGLVLPSWWAQME